MARHGGWTKTNQGQGHVCKAHSGYNDCEPGPTCSGASSGGGSVSCGSGYVNVGGACKKVEYEFQNCRANGLLYSTIWRDVDGSRSIQADQVLGTPGWFTWETTTAKSSYFTRPPLGEDRLDFQITRSADNNLYNNNGWARDKYGASYDCKYTGQPNVGGEGCATIYKCSATSSGTAGPIKCADFFVLNPATGQCYDSGYRKCPDHGHWDSTVRGVGGCTCDANYWWDDAAKKCVTDQATPTTTPAPASCPTHSHWDSRYDKCRCDSGFDGEDGNSCTPCLPWEIDNDSSEGIGSILSNAKDVSEATHTFIARVRALANLGLPGVLGIFGGDALANVIDNIADRGFQIRIWKDGNAKSCVNVKGSWPYDGGDVLVYPCTNNIFYPVNEAWHFVSTGDSPWYLLESSLTDGEVRRGMCVKAQGSEYTGAQLWTTLHRLCNSSDPLQQFTLLPVKDDIFLLMHRGSGQCMSRYDGQKLRTAPCNTSDDDQWLQICVPGQPCIRPKEYMCSH